MRLVRGAWKILVGIKDALVLVAMLLFFGLLFAALSSAPNPASIRDGALLLKFDGQIVEQPVEVDPFALIDGRAPVHQYRLRDVVRALDKAKGDDRVKAVVLDLDSFGGGYPAAINEVAEALGRVRESGKPVLAYATAYTDSGYRLAANASEIWMSPMGGTLVPGPGRFAALLQGADRQARRQCPCLPRRQVQILCRTLYPHRGLARGEGRARQALSGAVRPVAGIDRQGAAQGEGRRFPRQARSGDRRRARRYRQGQSRCRSGRQARHRLDFGKRVARDRRGRQQQAGRHLQQDQLRRLCRGEPRCRPRAIRSAC